MGLLPKRYNDVSKCEMMRFFKLYNNKGCVEPLSMAVPRKVRLDFTCMFSAVFNMRDGDPLCMQCVLSLDVTLF